MELNGPIEKYLHKKIVNRPKTEGADDRAHVLTDEEASKLKKIQFWAIFNAALAGALGVIILYVPKYIWPEMFPATDIWIPFYDDYIKVEVVFLLYSLVLVILEIAYLTYNNIQTVKKISHACNYPNFTDPFFEMNVRSLIAVGLEKKVKEQSKIGINPFAGLSKWQVLMFTVLNLAKAAMTNFLFKLIFKRALGRYAIRILVDLAGIPVYAFWNAYAARFVVKECRVRIMANPIIKDFAVALKEDQKDNPEFIQELYYMLDFVAITKRKFHANHYMLALVIFDEFNIEPDPNHVYDEGFYERMQTKASPLTIEGFSKINLMGMALDGSISKKEQFKIKGWREDGIYKYTLEETRKTTHEFFSGAGELSIL